MFQSSDGMTTRMVVERERLEGGGGVVEKRRRSRNLPNLPNNNNNNNNNSNKNNNSNNANNSNTRSKVLFNNEEATRSRSLPKGGRTKSNPREEKREKLRPAQSLALLVKPDTVELPIIVDSTTKWISGVRIFFSRRGPIKPYIQGGFFDWSALKND